MAHQRQIIRAAIRQLLINAATAAGNRVFPTRVLPLRHRELPVIAVYTLEESVDAESQQTAPRELQRKMNVTIEGWVAASAGVKVDDAMDDLALQIETAMHADPYLAGAVGDAILAETEMEVVVDGDRELGLVFLTYQVTYWTLAPEPPVLDDFKTVRTTHNLGGAVHKDNVAVDQFNVKETP